MTGALNVRGMVRRFKDFTLEADFRVAPGERVALVGRSGSGKTSLLRWIAGLDAGDGGRIDLGEEDITLLPPERRQIGYVFQEQALFPALDVIENAAFGLRVRGHSRKAREARVMPWLERVGLGGRARESVGILSGGERQRVAFIRALVWQPKLVLLDEPFSAMDAEMRQTLRAELVELHRLWPVPLVLVTHDEVDLEAVATARIPVHEEEGGRVRRFCR